MKVLIATPNYSGKEYCFQKWIDCVNRISHTPKQVLVVDNTKNLDFFEKWRMKVPMEHIDLGDEPPNRRIALSMEVIRTRFLESDYDRWFSLESDCLVPDYALSYMLANANGFDFVTLPYPSRTQPGVILERSFGVTLFSRSMMERVSFKDAPADQTTDSFLWGQGRWKWRCLKSAIRVEHLKDSTGTRCMWLIRCAGIGLIVTDVNTSCVHAKNVFRCGDMTH